MFGTHFDIEGPRPIPPRDYFASDAAHALAVKVEQCRRAQVLENLRHERFAHQWELAIALATPFGVLLGVILSAYLLLGGA